MFLLKNKQIGGYKFGQKTTYTDKHLGTDYRASCGTTVYMPFTGQVTRINGTQGGLTAWIKPDNQDVIIRIMHLSDITEGHFVEGSTFAKTGNSGTATTGCHAHVDISKNKVDINNFNNFIDPEQFNWGKETTMITRGQYEGELYDQMGDGDKHQHAVREALICVNGKTPTEQEVVPLSHTLNGDISKIRKSLLNKWALANGYMLKSDCKPLPCPDCPECDCEAQILEERAECKEKIKAKDEEIAKIKKESCDNFGAAELIRLGIKKFLGI